MRSSSEKSSINHVWNVINIWVFGPSIAAVVIGLILLAFPIDETIKLFVSGALIGVGAGGAIAEILAALGRFEDQISMRQLRDPILAQCRLAFRIAEFSFPAAQAISEGRHDARELRQALFLSELLGVRSTLQDIIDDSDAEDPDLNDRFIDQIIEATIYIGGPLFVFFRLGFDIVAMRAPGLSPEPDSGRALLLARTEENLKTVKEFTDGTDVAKSWKNFHELWNRKELTPEEIHSLLVAFYAFFLVLGHKPAGFLPWKAIIDGLASLKLGKEGRPAGLAQIFDAIRNENPPVAFDPITAGTSAHP